MAIVTKLKDLTPAREKYRRKIKLLSGGLVNGDNFPDGQITIYPWDNTVDDWIATKMRKGAIKGRNILFSVVPKIADLNGCLLDNFVSSEVLLVLMVSRSILRNDQVTYQFECPHCGDTGEATLKIPDQLEKIGAKDAGWPGYDLITLPGSQDVVKVRPVTVGEELKVLDRPESEKAKTCNDSIGRIIAGIVDVNGGKPDSPAEAITWINALPPGDLDYLIAEFDKTQPQLSTTVHHKCDSCGKDFDHSLRLDEDFFRRANLASDRRKVVPPVPVGVQNQGSGVKPEQSAGANPAQANRLARKTS